MYSTVTSMLLLYASFQLEPSRCKHDYRHRRIPGTEPVVRAAVFCSGDTLQPRSRAAFLVQCNERLVYESLEMELRVTRYNVLHSILEYGMQCTTSILVVY
jgi:hypothetical protein